MEYTITRVPGAKICMTNQGIKRIPLTNADDSGGHWVTTDDGNHLFITEGGEVKTGPGGKTIETKGSGGSGKVAHPGVKIAGKDIEVKSGEKLGDAYKRVTGSEMSDSYVPAIEPGIEPIQVSNEKSKSSGDSWKRTTLEATVGRDSRAEEREPGFKFAQPEVGYTDIVLSTPKDIEYDHPNKNTTTAKATIKAGIYQDSNSGGLKSHNINWDKVTEVSGKTFEAKEFLKSKGFKYSDKTKTWVNPKLIDAEARSGLTS